MCDSDDSHSGFFMGALVGGAIGAFAALLFTTKQGHKIQKKTVETFHDLEDSAKEFVDGKLKKPRSKRKSHAK